MEPNPRLAKTVEDWLSDFDEETIYQQIAMRTLAAERDPASVASFDPTVTHNVAEMGPLEDLTLLGRRVVRRWNTILHQIACGDDPADAEDRNQINEAMNLGDTALAAALGAALIKLGIAAAIGGLVAAIIVRRFLPATKEEVCKFWGEKLT